MTYLAAAIQMTTGAEKAANLAKAERLIRLAAARGAQIVALPEVFNWRGKRSDEAAAAESLEGETLTLMARLARELRIHLLAGSITEQASGEIKRYNSSVMFEPDGSRLAVYRKIHLFDVDLPGRVTVKESEAKLSGREVITAATDLGTVGLSICYDVRFPELYRRLAFAGARILTIPSAFTFPTGEAHWEVLMRARAVENQAYVIAPAQFGPNVHGFSEYGNSMIVDPWGRVLARAPDQEGVIVAPLDMEYLEKVRRELPALAHARIERERL
ncbi:MAG TPA: carbon-nitrogen hydrolase family protein [Candidatus Binataceae bacterium]|nr:carbon-nitrogen hydrolase family protein [Candidatus Binataceae bacterium]